MYQLFYRLEAADTFLYHYTTAEALTEYILPTLKVRLSRFSNTNDPREYKAWEFDFGTATQFDAQFNYSELQLRASNLAKTGCRLLCLTSDSPSAIGMDIDKIYGRGFCRPRMWAQYARNHTGACLVFNRAQLDQCIRASVPPTVAVYSGPVVYKNRSQGRDLQQDPFILNYDVVRQFGLEATIAAHLRARHRELFFEKSLDWSNENEFRWVVHQPADKELYVSIDNCLAAIVLGVSFPDVHKPAVQRYLTDTHKAAAVMNWKYGGIPEVLPTLWGTPWGGAPVG